jgi:hypothetical protein
MEYRAQAAELLKLVDKQPDVARRDLIFDMAATYVHLANQIEEIHRLGDKR